MKRQSNRAANSALWGVAILGGGLLAAQTALADSGLLTVRYVLNALAMGGAILVVIRIGSRSWRDVPGPLPEPVSLILAGLVVLCLWAPSWWLMDWTNSRLERAAGALDRPPPLTDLGDALLGLDLHPVSYELEILFAVVILPLVGAWLVWGLLLPELAGWIGSTRAAWIAGGLAGLWWTLIAVQNVAPALPWGLAALGGYVLIGIAAAWAVTLTGSPWAGFSVWGTFAYATFAWRDDLFREFAGKGYLDPAWLTVIVLGLLGAGVLLQVLRFRVSRLPEPDRAVFRPGIGWWLAWVVIGVALVVLVALDIAAR